MPEQMVEPIRVHMYLIGTIICSGIFLIGICIVALSPVYDLGKINAL